jgi:hypothetical protein
VDEENDVIPKELPQGEGALQVPWGKWAQLHRGNVVTHGKWVQVFEGKMVSLGKWAHAPSRKCFPRQLGMLPLSNFGPCAKRSMYPWGT